MPNLRQLEYLIAIADTRHFRRAADLANTTQPTLSEQLKALEERLGAQLVERSRTQVSLTPVGGQIVEIARRMLADAADIRALAKSRGNELTGVIRLGLPPTIGPYLLPQTISDLQKEFRDLKLYVREELASELPRGLEDGRHDVVISLSPQTASSLIVAPLFREPIYLAVPKGHRLAKAQRVSRADLRGEEILALGPGHQLHDAVVGLSQDVGAVLRHEYAGTSLDTLREMVAMGLGVTFLPGLYVRALGKKDPNIIASELADRRLYRTVALIWRRTSPLTKNYQNLARFFRAQIKKHFKDFTVLSADSVDR